jgi:hypothetical protein
MQSLNQLHVLKSGAVLAGVQMEDIKKLSLLQSHRVSEEIKIASLTESSAWPETLAEPAFHGPLGKFVRLVAPHTESDPIALLMQALVAAGNVLGRQVHFRIEADEHYLNEFVVIVGESSRGRKGTSLGYIKRLFKDIDPVWASNCIFSGISSGEGLIYAVRDAIIEADGSETPEQKIKTIDAGVIDKRCLAVETEFGGVLRVLPREGNRLSAVMRDAWDSGDLRTMTKGSPARATGAHISVVGHITRQELKRYISDVDVFNGFANRFLWVASKRAQSLPLGGKFDEGVLKPIRDEVELALMFASKRRELSFSNEAELVWRRLYAALDKDIPGILGVLTARAPAHILRLSSIYAALDCSPVVEVVHLNAAIAIWDYSASSCRYIFGRSTGDRKADRIYEELSVRPNGLTQTEVFRVFGNNESKTAIAEALKLLENHGLAYSMQMSEEGSIRFTTKWFKREASTETNNEFNESDESAFRESSFNS